MSSEFASLLTLMTETLFNDDDKGDTTMATEGTAPAQTRKPRTPRAPNANGKPRQNRGAKLAGLKQYVDIKLQVLTGLAGETPTDRLKGQISELEAIQTMLNAPVAQ